MAEARQSFGSNALQALVRLAVSLFAIALLLFWPAGTLDWPRGWHFLLVVTAVVLASLFVTWRKYPQILTAPRNIRPGTKRWDYFFVALINGGMLATLPVAGLDHRFGWTAPPDWLVLLGYLVMLAGFAGTAWARLTNRYFEPGVRIQSDRDQQVVDTGPYAQVRHPGYLAGSLMAVGIALSLGSLWALVPAGVVVLALVLRTLGEDATLRAELRGYSDYAGRVRYRWLPWLW